MKRTSLILMILLAALLMTAACSSRTYDSQTLARIQVTGADGFGLLTLASDNQLIQAILGEESALLAEDDEAGLHRLFLREAALSSLVFTADQTNGLKNGDVIVVRADYDRKLAKEAGIRFRTTRFKYLVSGLKEAEVIDIKAGVKLQFSGYNGRGTASVSLSGDVDAFASGFNFVFTTSASALSNGDLVEVKILADNQFLTSKGKIARDTSMSFEVEGLPPLAEVDLFSQLVLIFDGVSDQGIVSLDTSRLPLEWVEGQGGGEIPVRFTALPSSGLSNGETIRVQAQVDQDWFAERGLKASLVWKEYQVSGLKDYPRNLDGMDLLPFFNKISSWLQDDLALRIEGNYWNRDYRTGLPVSRWDTRYQYGVQRLFYGYEQANRASNFLGVLYKVEVSGTCLEATPYQSAYEAGDRVSGTLYLLYVAEEVMYDRPDLDDFREIHLRFHGDAELDLVGRFKSQYGGEGIMIVDVQVPTEVAWSGS